MLESIYWHAGYDVGTFTSPHLWRFNERIRFNGVDAARRRARRGVRGASRRRSGRSRCRISRRRSSRRSRFFAAAIPTSSILEVGMGGRLDATNALDTDCALIVSIDLDHREWLGETRDAIGREKAGIVRPGKPVVIGDRAVPRSVLEHAAAAGRGAAPDRPRLRLSPRRLALAQGARCRDGAAVAAAAVRRRRAVRERGLVRGRRRLRSPPRCPSATRRSPPESRTPYLRGRLERHDVDGVEWVFDVGHNPAAAAVLEASLRRLPAAARTWIVFAAMRDKDLAGVVQPFVAAAAGWFVAQASTDRGATGAELGDAARESRRCARARRRRRRGCVRRRASGRGARRSRRRLRIVPYRRRRDRSASAILRTLPIG